MTRRNGYGRPPPRPSGRSARGRVRPSRRSSPTFSRRLVRDHCGRHRLWSARWRRRSRPFNRDRSAAGMTERRDGRVRQHPEAPPRDAVFWRVPAAEDPKGPRAGLECIAAQWCRVDHWIDTHSGALVRSLPSGRVPPSDPGTFRPAHRRDRVQRHNFGSPRLSFSSPMSAA
jgi:hypothetical protein